VSVAEDSEEWPPGGARSIDPDRFAGKTPAVILLRDQHDVNDTLCVAHFNERDSVSLRVTHWNGRRGLVPAWRVCDVVYLETEHYSPDGEPDDIRPKRVCECDRQYLPDEVTDR
jgi:hypothetical protein